MRASKIQNAEQRGLSSQELFDSAALSESGIFVHIFIVWSNARDKSPPIEKYLRDHFDLVAACKVQWSAGNFSENMARFYGRKLPSIKAKVHHCGTDAFDLFLVRDEKPNSIVVNTSSGPQVVNASVFECKKIFRDWTGGGHRIHATNNNVETLRDLALLLGPKTDNYLGDMAGESALNRDLAGAEGWASLSDLFVVLNRSLPYVVLRNFGALPDEYLVKNHGDIDFLVSSFHEAMQIMNAKPVYRQKYRRYCHIRVAGNVIPIDLRSIGDNYYDRNWQVDILKSRVLDKEKAIFVPSKTDYYFSLLYHALVQKRSIADDYIVTFNKLRATADENLQGFLLENSLDEDLDFFMNERRYRFVRPDDASVFFNEPFLSRSPRDVVLVIKNYPPLKAQLKPKIVFVVRTLYDLLPPKLKVIARTRAGRWLKKFR